MLARPVVLVALVLTLPVALCRAFTGSTSEAQLSVPPGFHLDAAMTALYGNYDAQQQTSNYDVPATTKFDLKGSGFELGDEIVVKPFWFADTTEGGKRKIVLLTYAVPAPNLHQSQSKENAPFSCHACVPLIGAAVFVKVDDEWKLESSSAVVSRIGAWGEPPGDVHIVSIGPRRIGIQVTSTYTGGGEHETATWLLVPWQGQVRESLVTMVANDNSGSCGQSAGDSPCYANRKHLSFVPGNKPAYYDVVLTLTGTDVPHSDSPKAKRVYGVEKLAFQDGTYKTIAKTGDSTSLDRFIAKQAK